MRAVLKGGGKRIVTSIAWLCVAGHALSRILSNTFPQDFVKCQAVKAIRGVDVLHQLFRLRHTKNIPDAEIQLIMRVLAENLQSYDQVIEVNLLTVPLFRSPERSRK
jgi:hypothetical protein